MDGFLSEPCRRRLNVLLDGPPARASAVSLALEVLRRAFQEHWMDHRLRCSLFSDERRVAHEDDSEPARVPASHHAVDAVGAVRTLAVSTTAGVWHDSPHSLAIHPWCSS